MDSAERRAYKKISESIKINPLNADGALIGRILNS